MSINLREGFILLEWEIFGCIYRVWGKMTVSRKNFKIHKSRELSMDYNPHIGKKEMGCSREDFY